MVSFYKKKKKENKIEQSQNPKIIQVGQGLGGQWHSLLLRAGPDLIGAHTPRSAQPCWAAPPGDRPPDIQPEPPRPGVCGQPPLWSAKQPPTRWGQAAVGALKPLPPWAEQALLDQHLLPGLLLLP